MKLISMENKSNTRHKKLKEVVQVWSEYNKFVFGFTEIQTERECLSKIEVASIILINLYHNFNYTLDSAKIAYFV